MIDLTKCYFIVGDFRSCPIAFETKREAELYKRVNYKSLQIKLLLFREEGDIEVVDWDGYEKFLDKTYYDRYRAW